MAVPSATNKKEVITMEIIGGILKAIICLGFIIFDLYLLHLMYIDPDKVFDMWMYRGKAAFPSTRSTKIQTYKFGFWLMLLFLIFVLVRTIIE